MRYSFPSLSLAAAALLCAVTGIAAPRPGHAAVIDRVAAVVGTQAITLSELNEVWGEVRSDPQLAALLPDREALLSHLIDQRLQLQKATELGIAATSDQVEGALHEIMRNNGLATLSDLETALAAEGKQMEGFRHEVRDQMTLARLTQREVTARVHLSDTEVRRFYDEHAEAFAPPPTMRLRQIQAVFTGLSEADRDAAQQRMEALAAELDSEDKFLAAERELAGTPGISTGAIGTFSLGDLRPELAAAVHQLESGQVSGLVTLPAGAALFLAQDVTREPPAPFDEIADTVRQVATREAAAKRTADWLAGLRQEAHIVIMPLDDTARDITPAPAAAAPASEPESAEAASEAAPAAP